MTLSVGHTFKYEDGLKVLLKTVNDSRCKPGVQCIWQGELAPELRLSGGDLGNSEQELLLGTERAKEKTVGSYQFTLVDATTRSITLSVIKPGVQTSTPEPQPSQTADELIRTTQPEANQLVTSPFTVTGEARGPWYFEASFPVTLVDANGQVLVETYAEAQGEWMTTEFVPFKSTLNFAQPTTTTGVLILKKSNASGEPERDDSRSIPVRFRD